MTDEPELTDDIVAKLAHKLRNEQTASNLLRSVAEQTMCDLNNIDYDPQHNTHRVVFEARAIAIARMQKEQQEDDARIIARREGRRKLVRSFAATVWDKLSTLLIGIAIATGLGWLANRLNIKLPGGGP